MLNTIRFYIAALFLPLLFSCSQRNNSKQYSGEVVAWVDTIPITMAQVDNPIRQELFDELNRIYTIRNISLQELIDEKLLALEAVKYNTTAEALKDSLVELQIKNNKLQRFISDNRYDAGIMVLERSLSSFDIESAKGNAALMERFKDYVINAYTDSLKQIYTVKVNLEPPGAPRINFNTSLIHYRGNPNADVTVTVVSDFKCAMCRKYHDVYDSLYTKYSDRVRFAYTNFGSYATISAIASESAARQGRFWEMHDALFNLQNLPDTSDVYRIARSLNLNIDVFRKDFESEDIKSSIEQNISSIINSGIYATPTVMVNSRPVFNSSSANKIERMILKAL
ncbi:MAG: thioredoxin domain-containing protein [Bacteroidales bacterium]|jgi:protein-disulfide isomerase|nr:thioredoxin domain-containing protein [Bacteroidales bacterium]